MAEKVTFGAKVDGEFSNEIKAKIAELGITGEAFLTEAYAAFNQKRNKSSVANDSEIKQLENHLTRVGEIFVSLCKSRQDIIIDNDRVVIAHENEVEQLKSNIIELKQAHQIELEQIKTDSKEQIRLARLDQAEVADQMKVLTADFSKEKSALQEDLVKLKKELVAAQNQITTQAELIAMLEDVKEDAKTAKDGLKKAEKKISDSESINIELAQKLKAAEKADFEKEKAILAIEKKAFEQKKADLVELDRLRNLLNTATNVDLKQTPMESVIQSISVQAPELIDKKK